MLSPLFVTIGPHGNSRCPALASQNVQASIHRPRALKWSIHASLPRIPVKEAISRITRRHKHPAGSGGATATASHYILNMASRDRLIEMLVSRSVRQGTFTLASGRQSSLYVDARLTTMSPDGLATIGPLALQMMDEAGWKPDSVGGLTLGADPVSYSIAFASALAGSSIRAFTVRKEAKAHGTGRLIEGPFRSGDRVVVIEDVITTGGSALRAIDRVRAAGGIVLGVLAVVDREEGGRESLHAAGHAVVSLARASDLLVKVPLDSSRT
jgi:orotate phosphoribosyltransferase